MFLSCGACAAVRSIRFRGPRPSTQTNLGECYLKNSTASFFVKAIIFAVATVTVIYVDVAVGMKITESTRKGIYARTGGESAWLQNGENLLPNP